MVNVLKTFSYYLNSETAQNDLKKKTHDFLCYRVINFHLLTRDIRWMSLQMTFSEFESEEISPSPAVSLSILCSTIPRHSP